MDVAELRIEVAERYRRLGLPSWPDPHPGSARPAPEEYSRVTDGARYRIGHARLRLWAEVLAELDGVEVETLEPEELIGPSGRVYGSGVRLTPRRRRTLPLVLLERSSHADPDPEAIAITEVAAVLPDLQLAQVPDCGCDACDDGSAPLLEIIDEAVAAVVAGPIAVLRASTWQASWHADSGSAHGAGADMPYDAIGLARRVALRERVDLPPGTETYVGGSWLH